MEAIAAGDRYSLALIEHKVYAWGRNERGELGNGGTSSSRAPTEVAGLGPVKSVSATSSHVVVLLVGGVQPPPPPLTMQPKAGELDLAWTFDNAERIVDRVFERPAASEAEEGAEAEESAASATGSEAGISPPTQTVKTEAEGRRSTPGQLRLSEGVQSVAITEIYEAPLEPVPYEIKFSAGKKARVMVATPLPGKPAEAAVPNHVVAPAIATPSPCPEASAVCSVTAPASAPVLVPSSSPASQAPSLKPPE